MVVEINGCIIFFFSAAELLHGFQAVTEAGDGADQTHGDAAPDRPAAPAHAFVEPKPQQNRSRDGQTESRASRGPRGNNTYVYQPPKPYTPATGDAFEDMMARFKRTSDDKMSDLSRVMDTRRGGNNRRSKK